MADQFPLLRRCLPHLYSELFGAIECDSTLKTFATGEIVPVPGTMDSLAEEMSVQLIQLIREIETLVGKVPCPLMTDWLRDVIDGRGAWKYLVEDKQ